MGRSHRDLRGRLLGYLQPTGKGAVGPHELVRAYLHETDPKHAFSGRAFDTYGATVTDANVIGGTDLVAVSMLSIEIRAKSRSGITPLAAIELDERQGEITALLERIDADAQLHELDERRFVELLGSEKSPGRLLHALLLKILSDKRGARWVATHKILARKRPGLFPVRDKAVSQALGFGPRSAWWRPWWEALNGADGEGAQLVQSVEKVRSAAGADSLPLLRVLDIIVWMREAGVKSLPSDLRMRLST